MGRRKVWARELKLLKEIKQIEPQVTAEVRRKAFCAKSLSSVAILIAGML